jgi:glutamine synthetase
MRGTVDALAVLTQSDTISLFEEHGVLTKEELESRYHIYLEKYSKQINIEAGVMAEMARRQIFPAVSAYAAELARDAVSLAEISAECAPQEERARAIAKLCKELYEETANLQDVLAKTYDIGDALDQAHSYSEDVRPAMAQVRLRADALEKLVPKDAWPFPGYEELLFKL